MNLKLSLDTTILKRIKKKMESVRSIKNYEKRERIPYLHVL